MLITADHGQGIGIGGHGHMSPSEMIIPCILWGEGVEAGDRRARSSASSPTSRRRLCDLLGVPAPAASIGRGLLPHRRPVEHERVVFVIPAHNEEENLPERPRGSWHSSRCRTMS